MGLELDMESDECIDWEQLLEDLRMKETIKQHEFSCIYNDTEKDKCENEEQILKLRKENDKLRESYAESHRGDEGIINDVFRKRDKTEMLAMQKASLGTIIEGWQDKVHREKMKLDLVKHDQQLSMHKLGDLKDQVDVLINMGDTQCESDLQSIVNVRNNEIDKVKIKNQAATTIAQKYKQIWDTLEAEVNNYPRKIAKLEKELKQEKSERDEIISCYRHAVNNQEKNVTDLSIVEKTSYLARRERDTLLNRTKKEVEERFQIDSAGKRKQVHSEHSQHNASQYNLPIKGSTMLKTDDHLTAQSNRQMHILNLTKVSDIIKDVIMVSDVNEVANRFEEQKKTSALLQIQITDRKNRLQDFTNNVSEIEQEIDVQNYSRGAQDTAAKSEVERYEDYALERRRQQEKVQEQYDKMSDLYMCIKRAVSTMFQKIAQYKLKPPHHNYASGDPMIDLLRIREKLGDMLAAMTDIKDKGVLFRCCGPDCHNKLMMFMHSRIQEDEDPARFQQESDDIDREVSYDDDLPDRQDYMSNQDIKNESQRLINANSRGAKAK